MTGLLVEVGPATVRGPNHADAEWVSAAIDGIDDEMTLIDECAVAVSDVWRKVMYDVVGGSAETIVLVCPTWWALSRVECIRGAASMVAAEVVVQRRAEALRERLPDRVTTVVEIAPEFVVVSSPDGGVHVAARGDTDAVVAKIPMSMSVVLDAAEGVAGAWALAAEIADQLRANGVGVAIADRDWVRHSSGTAPPEQEVRKPTARRPTRRNRRAAAIFTGTVLSVAVVCVGFATQHDLRPYEANVPMTLLVEGRVGVMVPAQWVVERVTAGPGSARVQVVSPTDAHAAVHITQSPLPPHSSHEEVVESLRGMLGQQPDGVFVDFNPSDRRADQAVATYREIRKDRHVAWTVLIDESLRIAIGCQSAPGHEESVRDACDRAIRSAHAVF